MLAFVLPMACGGNVDDAEPSPTDPPLCASDDRQPVRLWVKRVEPTTTIPEGCGTDAVTVVDLDARCTIRSATTAVFCGEASPVRKDVLRLGVTGPGLLPTLQPEMAFDGTDRTTYLLAGLATSFAPWLPAFGPDTAAAVVAVERPVSATGCGPDGVVARVASHPEAIVRYVGGGAATDLTGFVTIEGVAPGQVVHVQLESDRCPATSVDVRLERGWVSGAATWLHGT